MYAAAFDLSVVPFVPACSNRLVDALAAFQAAYHPLRAASVRFQCAAGNSAIDACDVTPANVPEVLTVAGSNYGDKFSDRARSGRRAADDLYRWSNTGAARRWVQSTLKWPGYHRFPLRCRLTG